MADSRSAFWDGIPWAVAVFGWGCTHLFSEARDRRKEIRAQLDKAYDQVQKLEQDSHVFHCAPSFDLVKSIELKTRVSSLKRTLKRIAIVNMRRLDPHIVALRRGITLQNFEQSNFCPQGVESTVLFGITHAAQKLEESLEAQYAAHYPQHFPFFRVRQPKLGPSLRHSQMAGTDEPRYGAPETSTLIGERARAAAAATYDCQSCCEANWPLPVQPAPTK